MANLPPHAANTISLVSTTHSKLLHVNVYTGRAELQRLFKFNVQAGQNQVQITGLPNVIQEDSLRVQGYGNVTIHYVSVSPTPPKAPVVAASPLIRDLNARKKAVQNTTSRYKTSAQALDSYILSMTVHDVPFDQVEALMGTYNSQASKIEAELDMLMKEEAALDVEIAIEKARIAKEREEADGGAGNRLLGKQLSLSLFAENEGEVELGLVYGVSSANWDALYDVRVDLEQAKESPLTLVYKAAIVQSTGEDWTNVPLTLETATPSYGVQIHNLKALKLSHSSTVVVPGAAPSTNVDPPNFPRALPVLSSSSRPPLIVRGRSRSPSSRSTRSNSHSFVHVFASKFRSERSRSHSSSSSRSRSPVKYLDRPVLNVTARGDGQFNHSVFQVPGIISVPSDGEAHNVTVVELKGLETRLQWYAVPRIDTRVHLKAKIKNTSEYVLIPGMASVYVDGTFISRSSIPAAGPDESFDCTLGLDSSIKLTYHPLFSKTSHRTPFTGFNTLGTTTRVTLYTQRVVVLNTKRVHIDALKLLDRLPVSEDERITVKILKPAELSVNAYLTSKTVPIRFARSNSQVIETAAANVTKAGPGAGKNLEDASSVASVKFGHGIKKKRFSTSKITLRSFGPSSPVQKFVDGPTLGSTSQAPEHEASTSAATPAPAVPAPAQAPGPGTKVQIIAQWDGADADNDLPLENSDNDQTFWNSKSGERGKPRREKESSRLGSDGKMNWLLYDIPPQGTVNLVLEWEVSATSSILVYEREI